MRHTETPPSDHRRAMLATILRLRLAGCAAAAALLLVLHALGTLPALAPFIGLLLVTLAAGVLVDRRGTNDAFLTLAVVDTVVLLVAIHLGGGPEAAGLPFLVLPAIAFGGALPRRATILLTIAAAVALGLDFAAYDLGWMGGAVPAATHTATWSRYGAIVTVSALAAATTATLGERWRAEERATRRLANERGRVGELQARIVSTVSHELRTPLSVIQAAAGTLGRYGDRMTAAERTWRLKKIEDAVQATTRLIEDVLPLGEVGAIGDAHPLTELVEVCTTLVADVRAAAPENVRLELAVAPDAPATWVDRRLARRALRDLLANAIRYSPAGGTIRVEIAAAPHDAGAVRLRVRDEGLGIPQEDRAFVFEPFYRGRNVDRLPGLGVGLSIAKREVELMGGTLELESSDCGASFVATLPVCGADESPARDAAHSG